MKKYKIDLSKINYILIYYDLNYDDLGKILDINPSTISYWFMRKTSCFKKKSTYNKINLLYFISKTPVLNRILKWLI